MTNLSKELIPNQYLVTLHRNNIEIIQVPFDRFRFDDEYLWGLAFYKICVLSYLVEMNFDYICYMDCDVFVQGSFNNIWEECSEHILLYDINHGLQVNDYRIFCNEIEQYNKKYKYITHYGGEFFAANSNMAIEFVEKCYEIYDEMISKNIKTTRGDEYIISLAGYKMRENISNAGAYIFRFWTGAKFNLVSSCYRHNPVTVLHVPSEKNRGLIRIFKSYISKNRVIPPSKAWKMLNISRPGLILILKRICWNIIKFYASNETK